MAFKRRQYRVNQNKVATPLPKKNYRQYFHFSGEILKKNWQLINFCRFTLDISSNGVNSTTCTPCRVLSIHPENENTMYHLYGNVKPSMSSPKKITFNYCYCYYYGAL